MNALLAKEFSDGAAAKGLQAVRGACQGEEGPVERLVHLERKERKSKAVPGTNTLPGKGIMPYRGHQWATSARETQPSESPVT